MKRLDFERKTELNLVDQSTAPKSKHFFHTYIFLYCMLNYLSDFSLCLLYLSLIC